ncbi:MAG: hypothetical protein A2103_04565 [Gammaproteobacteria bacterium GWF2_41_13]|nr:MAG: hypothetical protein A2103_04565 [Gammaproteobacteria bacterium GWF2_41_13]
MFLKQSAFSTLFFDALSRRVRFLEDEESFLKSRLQRLAARSEKAKRPGLEKKLQRVQLELQDLRETVYWPNQDISLEHYRMLCMTLWQQEKCDVFRDDALKASVINCIAKTIIGLIGQDMDKVIEQFDLNQEMISSIIQRSADAGYLLMNNEVEDEALADQQVAANDWSTLYR